MTIDASILFPNEGGVSTRQAPAAETRPSRTDLDDAAARIFPNEGKAEAAQAHVGDDPAATLFKDEATTDYEAVLSGELDRHTLDAIKDEDRDRADALKAATSALTDDFRAAGTPGEEVKSAFEIIREHNHSFTPPTAEQIAADFETGMTTLQDELGPSFQSDLDAARAFIRDLETVAPGTMASLERYGAGNDPRLVRAAIKEARRRGYQ